MRKIAYLLVIISLLVLSLNAATKREPEIAEEDPEVATASKAPQAKAKPKGKKATTKKAVEEVEDGEAGTEEAPTLVDDGEDADRTAIMQEWEEIMQDFVPDEMLTFEINQKSEEVFMEDITVPTMIRGAYFVSYFSKERIDFSIRDPAKNRIHYKFDKREGVFSVNVTDPGQYEFLFSNLRGKEKKAITFAVDVHNVTQSHLQSQDLDPVEKKLDHISSQIRDSLSEQRFASKRQTTQLQSIEVAHNRLMIFSIVEVLIVIIASSWQVYYIKKILDNKRIV